MENLDLKIRKNAINSGLLFGLISFVLGIFTFYFVTSLAKSFWLIIFGPVLFSIIIPIVIIVFFCIDIRKKIGGFWTFKQATTGIAIMFFMAFLVQTVGRDLIFAKLIEPNMAEKMQTSIMNATIAMMEKSGADQATIDKKTDDIEKQFESQKSQTVGKTIQGYAISLLLIFVLALIFGAIFKKNPLLPIVDPFEAPAES